MKHHTKKPTTLRQRRMAFALSCIKGASLAKFTTKMKQMERRVKRNGHL